MIGLNTTVSVSGGGADITIKSDPFAVIALVVVIVVAVIKWKAFGKSKRKLRDSVKGRDQFITFDESGFRYGWSDVVSHAWSWEAVASVKYEKDVLIFRVGRHRIQLHLLSFDQEEIESLCSFLRQRRMLESIGPVKG